MNESTETLTQIIDLSIQLELAIARLYRHFSETIEEDSAFWWDLQMEENGHAEILELARTFQQEHALFPEEMVHHHGQRLRSELQAIKTRTLEIIETGKISRREALKTALKLEGAASETTFQLFMKQAPDTQIGIALQKINGPDVDHAKRIQDRLKEIQPGKPENEGA
jgi:CRISPR/Cas system-associated endonuclease Cas1